ncbi:cation-translocating P-type ATPase [Nanoarchaeota archaeon]
MTDYYSLEVSEAIKQLNSSEDGLTNEKAAQRLKQFGPNEIKKVKKITPLQIFLSQFKNALILLLVFAGVLSLIIGEALESGAIFGILMLNAILGFVQEYRAEKAMEALQKLSSPYAKVIRDNQTQKVLAKDIVPGDIIVLEAGDLVPADARLLQQSMLQVNEASLTGESIPSKKITEAFKKEMHIADQENMIFMGTAVTYGKAKAIITSTGMKTEFGKVAHSIQTTKEVKTPLQIKFEQLAKQIGIVAIALIIIVFGVGLLSGNFGFNEMLLFALALTVSTIPNSLPIIVTVSLSMGAKRLAKKNMLIKKLPAAESLGAATYICTDKTGTITKNEMTITKIFTNSKIIDVSGVGYIPEGNFSYEHHNINPKEIELMLRIGFLCNNAKLSKDKGKYNIIGDPTEGSLIVLGKKGQLDHAHLKENFSFVQELPFDSDRKRMSVIYHNNATNKTEAYIKGAPDLLLEKCSLFLENGKIKKITDKDRQKIIDMNNHLAENALRVLGLAYRKLPDIDHKEYGIDFVEKNLVFVGLVGMIDPPRDEVKEAIVKCNTAGIKVTIITGDQAITTKAIAEKIGLLGENDLVIEATELEQMSDEELLSKIENIRVIARALPIQKVRIVDALQKRGQIVAMTGDGVNDAPALKKADIGIAMGITGTDVSKEVAKGILEDDNFATIVNAIEEGRNIYEKMIKSAKYLLSCNAGEIIAVFTAIMIGLPLPLLPLMLLLMNLLTDDFPALGLGFERNEKYIMNQPPRNPKQKPITSKLFISIIIFGLIMGLGTFFMFTQFLGEGESKAQTIAFTTLVMFQMFAVINSRSLRHSWKHLNPFTNLWLSGAVLLSLGIQAAVIYLPPLQAIFGTVALQGIELLYILGISSLGFIVMEISKFIFHRNPTK